MYHFDAMSGESPAFATVNEAPLESYVGLPTGVNESDCPEVKSMFTDLPSAVSAGQLAIIFFFSKNPKLVRSAGRTACERIATVLSRSWGSYPRSHHGGKESLQSHVVEE